jgi:hypothetical protein
MEVLYLLTNLINAIFIKGLFISILSIMIAGKILKRDSRIAFAIIKWLILVYAGLNIGYYFIAYFSPVTRVSFLVRATGSYNFAYYIMLVPNTVLPLLLMFKKPGRNGYVLLALSFLMNIGWAFELFVIYSTDIHRDHIANQLSFNYLWLIVLNGAFIGSVIYAIGRAINRKMLDIHTPVS